MKVSIQYRTGGVYVNVKHGDDEVSVETSGTVASALDIAVGHLYSEAYARYRRAEIAWRETLYSPPTRDVFASVVLGRDRETARAAARLCDARVQLDACEYLRAPELTLGALRDGEPGRWCV